jgi:hypothetical protein
MSSGRFFAGTRAAATSTSGKMATVAHGDQVAFQLVGQVAVGGDGHRQVHRREQHRVAVGRRLRRRGGTDRAARPAAVVQDELVAGHRRAACGQRARDGVGAAAGRERGRSPRRAWPASPAPKPGPVPRRGPGATRHGPGGRQGQEESVRGASRVSEAGPACQGPAARQHAPSGTRRAG